MSAPSYDAATTPLATDVKNTIESTLASGNPVELSDADLKVAHTAIAEKLKSPELRDQIKEDVTNLAEIVVLIEKDFETIGIAIEGIDGKNILPTKYAERWNEHRTQYSSLLGASQQTAVDAVAVISHFTDVVFPVLNLQTTTEVKKVEILDEFIKIVGDFQGEASQHKEGFKKLKEGVNKFRINLNDAVKDETAEVKQQITACDERIKELEAELAKISGFFNGCWETLKLSGPSMVVASEVVGGVAGVGAIAATAGLVALAPIAGIAMVGVGISALIGGVFGGYQAHANNKADLENKIQEKTHELESLGFKKQELEKTAGDLKKLEKTFNNMYNRLGAMEGIWNMMKNDAQQLKTHAKIAKKDKDEALALKLKLMEGIYRSLHGALDNYHLAVGDNREKGTTIL